MFLNLIKPNLFNRAFLKNFILDLEGAFEIITLFYK